MAGVILILRVTRNVLTMLRLRLAGIMLVLVLVLAGMPILLMVLSVLLLLLVLLVVAIMLLLILAKLLVLDGIIVVVQRRRDDAVLQHGIIVRQGYESRDALVVQRPWWCSGAPPRSKRSHGGRTRAAPFLHAGSLITL